MLEKLHATHVRVFTPAEANHQEIDSSECLA